MIHSLVQLVFVMEIPSGALKNLINVPVNVFSAVTFDQSEEICIGSAWVQDLEAPPTSDFISDNYDFGSKSCEQKIEKKRCS